MLTFNGVLSPLNDPFRHSRPVQVCCSMLFRDCRDIVDLETWQPLPAHQLLPASNAGLYALPCPVHNPNPISVNTYKQEFPYPMPPSSVSPILEARPQTPTKARPFRVPSWLFIPSSSVRRVHPFSSQFLLDKQGPCLKPPSSSSPRASSSPPPPPHCHSPSWPPSSTRPPLHRQPCPPQHGPQSPGENPTGHPTPPPA